MAERIYRDPVHNIISLDESNPHDRILIQLIDTREMQRLRRIKQLGLALFTYQGAEHSRFTHSLGVLHLMRRTLRLLSRRHPLDEEVIFLAECAALLHDIGHGPFSHVVEAVLGYHHEEWTRTIITDETTDVNRLLTRRDPHLPEQVVAILHHRFRPNFICQLISSQMDVDRFDYLLRDSLMTGAKYGFYDLEWIIHSLDVDPDSDRLYVVGKGLYAVEEYLQARYYMYRQVYFHRNLRAAEVLMNRIFLRASELAQSGELRFLVADSPMAGVLQHQPLRTSDYVAFDDHDVMFHIKQWATDPDPILSNLARRFLHRRVFKSVDLTFPAELKREFIERARKIVESAGLDPRYYLGEDRVSDVPYFGPYSPDVSGPENHIFVEVTQDRKELKEITEVSPVVRRMRRFHMARLCYPEEVNGEIQELLRSKPFCREARS
jgi:hypothetical protein